MDETQINQEQLLQLLHACYSYLRDNGLLDDFSDYAGIPLQETPQNVPETGSTEATPKESIESTAE
jgi:hypothetical protein